MVVKHDQKVGRMPPAAKDPKDPDGGAGGASLVK